MCVLRKGPPSAEPIRRKRNAFCIGGVPFLTRSRDLDGDFVDLDRGVARALVDARDDLLALADRRLRAAQTGAGHVLFLAGEAGIGKTRLLEAVVNQARRLGFEVVRAGAATGGVLLDLTVADHPDHRAAGAKIRYRLASGGVDGDEHRRRRLLVLDRHGGWPTRPETVRAATIRRPDQPV
jgi:hypothetical protein